jgi:eukaryotic-like serine/threonine-protein kinase
VSTVLETTAGQIVAGRYELETELARGGMGTVWVARDEKLGRRVALKVMLRQSLEAFPDARERFEREARVVAALRSAHVVQIHDYGLENGIPFIAMELLEGENLKQRLARVGSMDVHDTAYMLRQVAKGLKSAHKAGLVHRDLKPSNIFIAHRDDEEVVKLLDFGVVKTPMQRGSENTASGVLLGTPQFMSPEQARGIKQIDHRADLWSLGVIVYNMLVGENPFDSEAEAVGDIVIRVCIEPIPPPSTIKPQLPRRLDTFFEKALDRDPDQRFQSIDDLMLTFMTCADLSFAGLDDRTMDPLTSGVHSLRSSGDSGPNLGLPKVPDRSGPDTLRRGSGEAALVPKPKASGPGAAELADMDEAGSTGARTSLTSSLEILGDPRRLRIIAWAAAIAMSIAGLVFWITRPSGETAPAAAAPSPAPNPAAADTAPVTTAVAPPPATRAEPSSTASSRASASSSPRVRPGVRPPPPKEEPEDAPPNWYNDKKAPK